MASDDPDTVGSDNPDLDFVETVEDCCCNLDAVRVAVGCADYVVGYNFVGTHGVDPGAVEMEVSAAEVEGDHVHFHERDFEQ